MPKLLFQSLVIFLTFGLTVDPNLAAVQAETHPQIWPPTISFQDQALGFATDFPHRLSHGIIDQTQMIMKRVQEFPSRMGRVILHQIDTSKTLAAFGPRIEKGVGLIGHRIGGQFFDDAWAQRFGRWNQDTTLTVPIRIFDEPILSFLSFATPLVLLALIPGSASILVLVIRFVAALEWFGFSGCCCMVCLGDP